MKRKSILIIICTFFLLLLLISPKRVVTANSSLVPLVINGKNVYYRNSSTKVMIPNEYVVPERELRAVWVSSLVYDIGPLTTETSFKNSFNEVLDKMEEFNMNTIIFHVRTHHDAFYRSALNKQSGYVGNVNVNFDSIKWAIEESHKRGIEFHAWLNPYRIKSSGTTYQDLVNEYKDFPNNPVHDPDNLLFGSGGIILNPGEPAVREFLIDTVMELIENYDVDAIHFDDYFYINGINDDHTRSKPGYNPNNLVVSDWRRQQIDIFIRDLSQSIRDFNIQNNRFVQFGISPTGIYRNGNAGPEGGTSNYDSNGNFITNGSNTAGQQHYDAYLYSNTKKWVDNEWLDYILPQTYWGFNRSVASYADVVDWWAKVVRYKNVNLYTGTGLYMSSSGSADDSWLNNPVEITMQVRYNTKHPEVLGNSIYSFKHLINYPGVSASGVKTLKEDMWNTKVLRPIIKSMAGNPLDMVNNFKVNRESNNTLTWDHLNGARGYVIYRSLGEINFDDNSQILDIIGFENTPTISYIDNINNQDYNYGIRAINGANELGVGTLEEEVIEDVIFSTTVSSNIGNNLIHSFQENSFYGDTNVISIISNPNYRYNFVTENGKIISYDQEYYFRVTDHQHFTAYFTDANMKSVTYVNLNDDLISFQIVNDVNQAIVPPNPGDIALYSFIGWTKTVLPSGDVIFRAAYEKPDQHKFLVTINTGTNTYQELVTFGEMITIYSDYPDNNTYWLVDGEIYSYDKVLEIVVYEDMLIELIINPLDEAGFIHLREKVISREDYFIYLGKFNLPAGVQLIETGLLVSNDGSENLDLSNPHIDKLRALSISSDNEFAIRKNNIAINETVYARGYLAYFDPIVGVVVQYTPIYTHAKELVLEKYYISYELNGGSLHTTSTQFTINDLPYTLPTPTKDGYIFAGWYPNNNFTNQAITVINELQNITLFAKWEQIPATEQFNITYHLDGGSWGYATKEDLANAFLADFHSYLLTIGVNSTHDLQRFMHSEGQSSGYQGQWVEYIDHIYTSNLKVSDASYPYFINQPEYNDKWLDFFDMLDQFIYLVNNTQSFWDDMGAGKVRLPQYIQNIKPANYVSDEIMAMLPTITQSANTYRNDRELILSTPIKDRYIFMGWYDNPDYLGLPVERILAGTTGHKVYYAKWEKIDYTITYVFNDPEFENELYTYTKADFPLELPIPTKQGAAFIGWYLTPDYSDNLVTAIETAGNYTLYAKWEMHDEEFLQNIINDIPKHLTADYQFPSYPGLTFSYASIHDNDEILFDLESGTHLKLRVTQQTRTIVATLNDFSATFEVDFGVVRQDQLGSYYDNDPYSVSKDEPQGTRHFGWSGYTITKGNLVHFVHHAIELNGSGLITDPTILNPHTPNTSIGSLYINVGNHEIMFTLSSLGDRIDSSSSTVSPVIVVNQNGEIIERFTNTTNRNTVIVLEPGASLWTGKYLDRADGLEFGSPSHFVGYDMVTINKYQ